MNYHISKIDDDDYRRLMAKNIKRCNGHCPEAIVRDETTKCPCLEFREMDHDGYCALGYLYKEIDR